jgi:hypothetical protein
MRAMSHHPTNPGIPESIAPGVTTAARMQRRGLPAAFAILTICTVVVHTLPLMAAVREAKTNTTTTLHASATAINEGDVCTLTAKVSPSKATGEVALFVRPEPGRGLVYFEKKRLVAGVARVHVHFLEAGIFSFEAVYEGSQKYGMSPSNIVTVVVRK